MNIVNQAATLLQHHSSNHLESINFNSSSHFNFNQIFYIFGNSIFLAALLSFATYLTHKFLKNNIGNFILETEDSAQQVKSSEKLEKSNKKENNRDDKQMAFNFFLICVGLTCMMILVQNNITRIIMFSATLALTRFRIKVEKSQIETNLIFSVIVGMSCGLEEYHLAYLFSIIYLVLQALTMSIVLINFNKFLIKKFLTKQNFANTSMNVS